MLPQSIGMVVGLMLIFCMPGQETPRGKAENPEELLRQAFQAQQSGHYQVAADKYEQFLKLYPDVADVHANLGAAFVQLGRLSEAVSCYRRALELGNGTNPEGTRFNLALAYYKSAQFDSAIAELEEIVKQNPEHLNAALVLADCYMMRGDHGRVISLLDPFEPHHPEQKALVYLLGTALLRSGDVERGQVLVDRILGQGESAEAHLLLGTARMAVRDVMGAIEEFQRAVELNPNLPGVNSYLARSLRETGQVEEALTYSKRELEINPFDFESHLYVGVYLYKREQKYEDALDHFARCLQIRPGALEARFQIGLVCILQGKTEEALEIVQSVVDEAPDFLEGHVTLTALYFRLRRRDEAEEHRRIVERLRAEKDRETVKQVDPDTNLEIPSRPPGDRQP